MKYKCTKDIHFHDTLVAAQSDEVEIINDSLINTQRGTRLDDWSAVHNMIKSGVLTKIDNEESDNVNHPSHYTWLKEKCGIEVIDITRHLDFDSGNAVKYLLRAGHKSEKGMTYREKTIQDLKKAIWYINDKIKTIENGVNVSCKTKKITAKIQEDSKGRFVVIEDFNDIVSLVTNPDSGNILIFETSNEAEEEARKCQNGKVVKL